MGSAAGEWLLNPGMCSLQEFHGEPVQDPSGTSAGSQGLNFGKISIPRVWKLWEKMMGWEVWLRIEQGAAFVVGIKTLPAVGGIHQPFPNPGSALCCCGKSGIGPGWNQGSLMSFGTCFPARHSD